MNLSEYRGMWMLALFDLPVVTKRQRKKATQFRKLLLQDGFCMLQYSVYARYCASEDIAQVHRKKISSRLPDEGQVRIVSLTDKQFGKMEVYCGENREPTEQAPAQLEFL